jgi:hypothetical protein
LPVLQGLHPALEVGDDALKALDFVVEVTHLVRYRLGLLWFGEREGNRAKGESARDGGGAREERGGAIDHSSAGKRRVCCRIERIAPEILMGMLYLAAAGRRFFLAEAQRGLAGRGLGGGLAGSLPRLRQPLTQTAGLSFLNFNNAFSLEVR